jgi:hypothetical protein
VRGEAVDARSDIFSFGLVLYEMLTGTHPFRKDSLMETASAILHQEPNPVITTAEGIPSDLEKLINRCLRKDLERRFQHIDDVRIALLELKETLDSDKLAAGAPAQRRRRSYLWTPMTLVAGAVVAVAAWLWLARSRPSVECTLTPVPFTTYPSTETYPSFSPDGTQVAFQWCPGGWVPGAKLRHLHQGQERVLEELDLTRWDQMEVPGPYLAWTPDSKWLALPSACCRSL